MLHIAHASYIDCAPKEGNYMQKEEKKVWGCLNHDGGGGPVAVRRGGGGSSICAGGGVRRPGGGFCKRRKGSLGPHQGPNLLGAKMLGPRWGGGWGFCF